LLSKRLLKAALGLFNIASNTSSPSPPTSLFAYNIIVLKKAHIPSARQRQAEIDHCKKVASTTPSRCGK